MKCLVCDHENGKTLLKCSECETAFDRETLEKYEHLVYLLTWLDEQEEELDPVAHRRLNEQASQQQARLCQQLRMEPIAPPAEA